LPVKERYWRQNETEDGTYDLDDLLDILEMIEVDTENNQRGIDADRREASIRHG
jgi:hypothetical protein